MTILETVLVFVGAPAAVVAIVYVLVFAGSAANGKRYRPGRPFNQTAVWYIANKPAAASVAAASAHEIAAGSAPHALAGGTGGTESSDTADGGTADHEGPLATVGYGETGGASDSW